MRRGIAAMLLALGACAPAPLENTQASLEDGVVPGTIGVAVRQENARLVVAAVGKRGAGSGVRVGDVVLRYNGEAVTSPRQFYRLVVDTPPGSVARLELLREGAVQLIEVPVGELDTTPRV
jgi:S1-C subfamily serine protease